MFEMEVLKITLLNGMLTNIYRNRLRKIKFASGGK